MKICTVCAKDFEPRQPLQHVCGLACAKKVPVIARRTKTKQTKDRREKIKKRSEHIADTQRAFNAYICRRDANLPCVSCGCLESPGWHASHYRSVGSAPALRFDPTNVHRSCVRCNLHLHGNPIPYRAELLRRIGLAELERLEGPQLTEKWTIEDLRTMRAEYRMMAKALG